MEDAFYCAFPLGSSATRRIEKKYVRLDSASLPGIQDTNFEDSTNETAWDSMNDRNQMQVE